MDAPDGCEFCELTGPTIAFVDADFVVRIGRTQPTGPGYALLASRQHLAELGDWPMEAASSLLHGLTSVSQAVVRTFGATGTTVTINSGPPGQRVQHLHMHIIPRRPGDGYPGGGGAAEQIDDEEAARQACLLGDALRRADR
jgi:histidine triad (HIT) family protein